MLVWPPHIIIIIIILLEFSGLGLLLVPGEDLTPNLMIRCEITSLSLLSPRV